MNVRAQLERSFGAAPVSELASGLPVVAPPGVEGVVEALRWAASDRLRVLPVGAGEHLPETAGFDFAISTRTLTRVVEYEPEEMVLVAQSGMTLHAVTALASPHRQRLGPGVWPGRAATLGGAVAADRNGLDRLGRGTWRDAVLGVRVVHSDGGSSKTGGKVVKNVTGYDLGKLYVGSFGTLAVLVEVAVRLVPEPEATATWAVAGAASDLLRLHRGPLQPVAHVLVCGLDGGETAVVRFEGSAAAVRWQTEQLRADVGAVIADATDAYLRLRSIAEPRASGVALRIASLPVDVRRVLDCVRGLEVPFEFAGQFGVGVCDVWFADLTAVALERLQLELAAFGARCRVPRRFDAGRDAGVQEVERGIRHAFDPESRFVPALSRSER